MSNTRRAKINNFLKFRDELSIQNIRWELRPLLLVPLEFLFPDNFYRFPVSKKVTVTQQQTARRSRVDQLNPNVVAQINVAMTNKGKATFRLPTVRFKYFRKEE